MAASRYLRKCFQIWVKTMRVDTTFASRSKPSETKEPKKQYYLVFEGLVTEPQYFKGVEKYRNKIGIKRNIILTHILREKGEERLSNPIRLIRLIEEFMNDSSLVDKIMDFLAENELIQYSASETIKADLQELIKNDPKISVEDIVKFLSKKEISCKTKNIEEYLESKNFNFDKNHDKICIIVDRDKKSFTKKQYETVLNRCSEKGYDFYVTNPCFEFWLCLHFEEASKLDCDEEYAKILENGKVSANEKYTYISMKLKEMQPEAYSLKNKTIKFEQYADGIDRAIKTIEETQRYSSNINDLKHTVGSNLGNLIKEIKN